MWDLLPVLSASAACLLWVHERKLFNTVTYWPWVEMHSWYVSPHHTRRWYTKRFYLLWLQFDNTQVCPFFLEFYYLLELIHFYAFLLVFLYCKNDFSIKQNHACHKKAHLLLLFYSRPKQDWIETRIPLVYAWW